MSDYKHKLASDVSEGWELHGHKGWRPTMAMPYFVGFGLRKAKCGCGRVFKDVDDFYAHYLYHAIWLGESTVLPTQWSDLAKQELSQQDTRSTDAKNGVHKIAKGQL